MELRRYLRILRRGWTIIVVCLVAGVVLGGLYLAVTPRSYTATTSVFLSLNRVGSIKDLSEGSAFVPDTAVTYAQIIDSRVVLGPVAARTGLSADDLAGEVSTNVEETSTVIDIAATGSDPVEMARIANATAAGAVATLPGLQLGPTGAPMFRLSQLGPAVPPGLPSDPRPQRALAVGIIVGLCVGVGSTMILQKFDDRVHRPADLEVLSGVPVLAVIPRAPRLRRRGRPDPRSDAAADGFRRVRAALLYGEAATRGEVMLCTPRHDGWSFARGVATALADVDGRTVLVDADPAGVGEQRELGGPGASSGLLDVLAGRATLSRVSQDVAPAALRVLSVGEPDPDHPGLADGPALTGVLRALTSDYEHVVLRSPPLLRGDGAAHVAAVVGHYVLAVEAGRTRAPELADALAVLRNAPGSIVGVVLTGARPQDVPGSQSLGSDAAPSPAEVPEAGDVALTAPLARRRPGPTRNGHGPAD